MIDITEETADTTGRFVNCILIAEYDGAIDLIDALL